MTSDHLSLERLSALVDHELGVVESAEAGRHLDSCAACRGELARLRALLGRVASLPPSIEPPPEAWGVVRARLRPHSARGGSGSGRGQRGWSWGVRAAAAILLVATSSAVTAVALRSRSREAPERVAHSQGAALVLPASARAMERGYGDVVDELTATLAAQRGVLAPETIAALERSLRVIDQAISEARAALAADPANGTLLDVLSANYQQKIELLRRVSELPART